MTEESWRIDAANAPPLKLLAESRCAIADHHADLIRKPPDSHPPTNYFKSALWSADGTCVVTNSADNHIRTFVIPPELLDERSNPLSLEPYAEIPNHNPTSAVVLYPGFSLRDVTTALVLSTVNEHPIRLHSALTSDLVSSYPLVNHTTEAYIKPSSLSFTPDGSHFIAGSDSLISAFDLSRPGQEPILSLATAPKRNKSTWSNPGQCLRGIVSALAIDQQHRILAAGTLTRHVGLYDAEGRGDCLGVFDIHGTNADKHVDGRGITQLLWSPCGTYLYIAERRSHGIVMYDIRQRGQMLGWMDGRQADTNQRLHVDLVSTGDESQHEIWAGGTDGVVRVWRDPYTQEGAIGCNAAYVLHDDVVSSSVVHPSGSVLATASGQRHLTSSFTTDRETVKVKTSVDNSLRIWSLSG